jgi:hypothetical protein
VCADAGLAHACLADLTKDNAPEMPAVAALLAAMKRHSRPVKPAALGVIGKDAIAVRFAASAVRWNRSNTPKLKPGSPAHR